jgi:hypothetical protein
MIKMSELFDEMEGRVMARGLVDELEKISMDKKSITLMRLGPLAKKLMRPGPRTLLKGTRGKITMTPGVSPSSTRGRIRAALQATGLKTSAVKTARQILLRKVLRARR